MLIIHTAVVHDDARKTLSGFYRIELTTVFQLTRAVLSLWLPLQSSSTSKLCTSQGREDGNADGAVVPPAELEGFKTS